MSVRPTPRHCCATFSGRSGNKPQCSLPSCPGRLTSRACRLPALFLLAVTAFMIRAVSFGLFMLALTPLVLLLVETGTPDTGEWVIAAARAGLTTIGGLVAVGANFLLWPSREPDLGRRR